MNVIEAGAFELHSFATSEAGPVSPAIVELIVYCPPVPEVPASVAVTISITEYAAELVNVPPELEYVPPTQEVVRQFVTVIDPPLPVQEVALPLLSKVILEGLLHGPALMPVVERLTVVSEGLAESLNAKSVEKLSADLCATPVPFVSTF